MKTRKINAPSTIRWTATDLKRLKALERLLELTRSSVVRMAIRELAKFTGVDQ